MGESGSDDIDIAIAPAIQSVSHRLDELVVALWIDTGAPTTFAVRFVHELDVMRPHVVDGEGVDFFGPPLRKTGHVLNIPRPSVNSSGADQIM